MRAVLALPLPSARTGSDFYGGGGRRAEGTGTGTDTGTVAAGGSGHGGVLLLMLLMRMPAMALLVVVCSALLCSAATLLRCYAATPVCVPGISLGPWSRLGPRPRRQCPAQAERPPSATGAAARRERAACLAR